MSDRVIRAGVIGLGVGEQHLKSYQAAENVEVVAICDVNPMKLGDVGDRYDVRRRHTDFRKVTENPNIDVVSICSHDDFHAEQCLSAFRNGKHVMVEKPVTLNRRDAEAVLRAQQDSGRWITSNLILRESPRFKELKRQIAAGDFGDVFCIEGDYVHDILWKITRGWRGRMATYCTIFGGGIHLIDLMRWLLGQEVEEVAGMGNKVLTRDDAYKFDDTFINILRFNGGALGKCLSTFGPRRTKFHSLNVYGTRRTFVNDMPNAKLFDGDMPENEMSVTTPYPGMEKGDMIPDFIAAIRADCEPDPGVRDIFRVMDICFAAREAAETGHNIKLNYLI